MGGFGWTEEEDDILKRCVERYGEGHWHRVPLLTGLSRCRKSCRLRWLNYLRPNIRRGSFDEQEVELIINLHHVLGNRWSLIADRLPGRTANDVKNYWNYHISKRFEAQEINQNKPISMNMEIMESMPLYTSSSLIMPPRHVKFDEGSSNAEKHVMGIAEDEETLGNSIDGSKDIIFFEEEIGMSSLKLEYFEGERVMEDKGSCSKWDWEDLISEMDLWIESL